MTGRYKSHQYDAKCHFEAIRAGDHIYYIHDKPIVFEHHGIYIGYNTVVHYIHGEIKESTLVEFAAGCILRKVPNLYIHGTIQ